ncbi:MAG: hypothetical protein AAF266_16595, partial [Planctomycetota bacterium]
NQTTPNYRSLHLERLANPLLPWNPPPTRPDGTLIAQHRPDLEVNPYLPVDARSLDLTAFNSTSLEESTVIPDSNSKYVNQNAGATFGPESRHRRRRSLTGNTGALAAARETAIGFVSNERGRPLGPFPTFWFAEPARLLWQQGGAATLTEIVHSYNRDTRNGYLAEAGDQVIPPDYIPPDLPDVDPRRAPLAYDEAELSSEYDSTQYVQVPWRWTLGFGDWMNGKFFMGSGLSWYNGTASPGGVEQVDLGGDIAPGDLLGRPEITDVPPSAGGANPATDAAANGVPDLIDEFTGRIESGLDPRKPDARGFLQQYLNRLAHDNSTTPELSWPNRPFASAGELMQVPVWGGSRMLTHFSVFNWLHTLNPHFSHRTQVNPYNGEWAVFHDGLDYNPGTSATSLAPGVADVTFDGDFTNDNTLIDNDAQPDDGSTNVLRFRETLGHFGHLINFFQTARFPSFVGVFTRQAPNPLGGPNITQEYVVPRGGSHFYRLMDYVHVPSRFTATDTILNVGVFSETSVPLEDPRRGLSAPFNRVDSYREPGRVNLNTIVGRGDPNELRDRWSEVYDGLMRRNQDGDLVVDTSLAPIVDSDPDAESGYDFYDEDGDGETDNLVLSGHLGPAWRDVALSRRGYVQPGFDPTATPVVNDNALGSNVERQALALNSHNAVDYSPRRLNPDFPTFFANPFRSPGEGANVPLDHMVQTG